MTALGGGSNSTQATAAGSLQFPTSQVGGVIPLVYGTTRVATNLLDYSDFTAIPQTGKTAKGKGALDPKAGGNYTYTASLILGICQGPTASLNLVWWNKNISALTSLPGISYIAPGGDNQAPDPYWVTNHPSNAIGYSGNAYFTADNYMLGYSAAMPDFSVEVQAGATSVNFSDANPSVCSADLLTNPRYGAGFPSANIDLAHTWADWQAYCDAAGIWLSPFLDQGVEAQQALQNVTQLSNTAIVWTGGLLKAIPYGDAPLSATYWVVVVGGTIGGLDTLTLTFSSPGLGTVSVNYQAQPAAVNTDTMDSSGPMGKLAQQVNGTPALTSYGITAGVGVAATVIRMGGADQSVTVTASASIASQSDGSETFTINGPYARSWAPITTVQYSLDDDDFIVETSSAGAHLGVTPGSAALRQGAAPITGGFVDDPVRVTRSSPADAMNYVAIECLDRSYSYNTQIVEVFDQAAVDLYGVRKDTSIKARAIADPLLCGQVVAQLVLQRNLAYRNTYTFRLGWGFCLLEPMDLVAISDSYLGLVNQVVRITSVIEDQEGTLTFTAEDWFGAVGAPGTAPQLAAKQGIAPTAATTNFQRPAPAVSTPFIMEPTPALQQAQGIAEPQVLIGLAAPGKVFGGAGVSVSMDGASYSPRRNFVGRSTMGVSTIDLAANGTSLTVDLAASDGTLSNISPLVAANGGSLCALRSPSGTLEFLTYTTATLVSGSVYTLTGLYRGLYGTPLFPNGQVGAAPVDMPIGSQFLYLGNGQYYAQTLPPQYVGHNLFFKFPAFNIIGGGGQDISTVPAYRYTPRGVALNPNPFLITARFPMAIEASGMARRGARAPTESR